MRLRPLDTIAAILASIGAINWGLVGAFEFDLVAKLFGEMRGLTRIVYVLVGLSGLYLLARVATARAAAEDRVSNMAHHGSSATR